MAKIEEKRKAIELRKRGMSYSQIKMKLGSSKGTLSGWLRDYPLSSQRIKELRDWNPMRIEHYRNTMKLKRERRLLDVYEIAKRDIGEISKRDIFIAGLFLYWGEGSKSGGATVSLSNNDPGVLKFFIKWLAVMNYPKKKMSVKLHLYSDMNIQKEISYWSNELKMPLLNFKKPYIKKSFFSAIDYKSFGHGTCMIRVYKQYFIDYILMALKYIQDEIL